MTATNTNPDQLLFGWKTSTNHWNDDGVFGHVSTDGTPIGDWQELRDPRDTNISLDLSFAIRTFPIVGINKDLKNTMTVNAGGVRIVVAGIHEVTWHYDDGPVPWPNFSANVVGGNTVLEWTGKSVAPNQITHVGVEMGGTSLTILGMSWLNPSGLVIGKPIQVNYHTWGNGTVLTLNNNLNSAPVIVLNPMVEFFADPVPLDQMNLFTQRRPLAGPFPMPLDQPVVSPGCVLSAPVPQAPPEARYALFVASLEGAQGEMTMDFVQLPLPMETQPIITDVRFDLVNSFFDVFFEADPNKTFRLQFSPGFSGPTVDSFFDIWTELSFPDGTMPGGGDPGVRGVMIPSPGTQGFIRVVQDPE